MQTVVSGALGIGVGYFNMWLLNLLIYRTAIRCLRRIPYHLWQPSRLLMARFILTTGMLTICLMVFFHLYENALCSLLNLLLEDFRAGASLGCLIHIIQTRTNKKPPRKKRRKKQQTASGREVFNTF